MMSRVSITLLSLRTCELGKVLLFICLFFIAFSGRVSLAANLITNGDFSSGNTGFSSSYTYVTGGDSATPEGTYSVVAKAVDVHSLWTSAWDHTSGTSAGKYFVANGSPDTSLVVWQSTSPIAITQANTNYRFKIWISTLYTVAVGSPGPELQFQFGDGTTWINMGNSIAFNNGDPVGAWNETFADGKFSTTGTYYIRLLNNQAAPGGNDFGLDDISFGIDPAGNGTTFDNSALIDASPAPAPAPEDPPAPEEDTAPAPSVVLQSSTPANNSSDFPIDANVVLNFSEAIYAGSGNIVIHNASDHSVVEVLDVRGARVAGFGTATISVNFSDWLSPGSRYYITIDPSAFYTAGGRSYAGIASPTVLAFITSVKMPNPLDDKDVVAGITGQADIARRFMQHSTYAVLERTEWLRIHRDDGQSSKQGVTLAFKQPELNQAATMFPLAKYLNPSGDLLSDGWAIWSSGTVSVGKVDETGNASLLDIESQGVTIGVDRSIADKHVLGMAIRIGSDDVGVGSSNSTINTDGYSLSMYGTYAYTENIFIDGVIGLSVLSIDSTRFHDTGTITGERDGDQVFGSVTFGYEFVQEQFNMTSYGRFDVGYTSLAEYSETGSNAALSYGKQSLNNSMLSVGIVADYDFLTTFGTIGPKVRLEYGLNASQSSNADMWYVSYPSTSYTLLLDSGASSNLRGSVGGDLAMNNGLSLNLGYERTQAIDAGYLDTLRLEAAYQFGPDVTVALAMGSDFSSGLTMGLDCNVSLGNRWMFTTGYNREQIADTSNRDNDVFNVKISRNF